MRSGPSKFAETIVGVLLPPACREEVLGDLHERYRSPGQYAFEALCTVPLVILSRIRRIADPQVLLMHAFAAYLSFLGAAELRDRALLIDQWGLLRLATPAIMIVLGMMLEDAYAGPRKRSPLQLTRGPVVGVALALASQAIFWNGSRDVALPPLITVYGCAMSLLMTSVVRLSFPPVTDQLQNVNVPTLWLKREGVSIGLSTRAIIVSVLLIALVILLKVVLVKVFVHS
jgi:hypothetical protein